MSVKETDLERDDRATKVAIAATDKLQAKRDKAREKWYAYRRLYDQRYDDAYNKEYQTELKGDKAIEPRYYDGRRDGREGVEPTSTSSKYSQGYVQGRRDRALRRLNDLPINEKWCRDKNND
jgi:hypothetical protein